MMQLTTRCSDFCVIERSVRVTRRRDRSAHHSDVGAGNEDDGLWRICCAMTDPCLTLRKGVCCACVAFLSNGYTSPGNPPRP
jgi:hypothetical protein